MSGTVPTLHMLCGKMASGKSTLADQLARAPGTVRITEDAWLAALFADQLTTGQDFMRCSGMLREVMGPHVSGLLNAGVSVVLDFQANTRDARAWMKDIAEASGAPHVLHVMETPDALCLDRLRARNASGAHPFAPTEAMFHQFSRHFAPPALDEGLTIIRHSPKG